MKLLKNISPMGIKVSLSIIDNNGQNLSVELNHGDFILVNDSGIETKSIIIQRRKGNIEVLENIKDDLIPYKKYSAQEVLIETVLEVNNNLPADEVQIVEDKIPNSMEEITTESETFIEVPKNKGGRPKGSFKKKSSSSKKKTSKNKKRKTSLNTNNTEL